MSIYKKFYILSSFKILLFIVTINLAFSFPLEGRQPKAAVIGAGLAGLTTAYRLQQSGIDVMVYEARERVGGRVLTVHADGHVVELGGCNIADGAAKNLLQLAAESGLQIEKFKVRLNPYYFNGEAFVSALSLLKNQAYQLEELEKKLTELASGASNMREVMQGLFDENDPLYKFVSVNLAGYEGDLIENLSPYYTQTLYQMLLGGIAVAHPGNGSSENTVDFLHIKGGNALLAEKLSASLKDRVHFGKVLSAVSRHADQSYALSFQDGTQAAADILVLTIPCTVYPTITFDNILPPERLAAIEQVRYGVNAKILVPLVAEPVERFSFKKDHMTGFFDISDKVVVLYYNRLAGLFTPSSLSEFFSRDSELLHTVLEGSFPSLLPPRYALDQQFAVYPGPVGYCWPLDPYAKGSYSYIAAGQEKIFTETIQVEGENVKKLFAPIEFSLYFAGEHTCTCLEISGTMEAACESGEKAAQMIIRHLQYQVIISK